LKVPPSIDNSPRTLKAAKRQGDESLSHIVTVQTEMKNRESIQAACKRLGLDTPVIGKNHRLFSGATKDGLAVQLPDWRYPVVITDDGKAHYDNYNGSWGEQDQLDRFMQAYLVEESARQGRALGYIVSEEVNQETGEIDVVAQMYN
jgi:hypothetical protein